MIIQGIKILNNYERSSKEEHRVDALALRAEERRDKLRKAAGRSTYPLSRRYLNGETRYGNPYHPYANP